jgi:hypothetical protein
VPGRYSLPYRSGIIYFAFVDVSGGSSDDAVLCIGHLEGRRIVIDLLEKQAGSPPFNPRHAVLKFAALLKAYHIREVWGDLFAGPTFPSDYLEASISYRSPVPSKTEQYELFEPVLNAGEIELLDHGKMQEQALCLVVRGSRIDAEKNGHDDYINAVAGLTWLIHSNQQSAWMKRIPEVLSRMSMREPYRRPMPSPAGSARFEFRGVPGGSIGERRFHQMQRRRGRY